MTCMVKDRKAEFLKQPVATNEINEVDMSVDADWLVQERAYCAVETGTGREVYKARQIHAEVSAVIIVDWTFPLSRITADHRIRVTDPMGKATIYCIIHPDDENMGNHTIKFGCRASIS